MVNKDQKEATETATKAATPAKTAAGPAAVPTAPNHHMEPKVPFNAWFSAVVTKRSDVKAHHMSAIKAHFKATGISELEQAQVFEAGLRHYGK
jgi:hypothetical protein